MVLREVVECIDESHCVPPHCPPPKVGGVSTGRDGPALFLRFVPAVIEQPGPGISCVTFHQYQLFRNAVEGSCSMKSGGTLSIKRFGHVKTVQPHLVRIDLLVPKAAV